MQSTYGCMLLAKVDHEVLGLGQHVFYTIVFRANSSDVMSELCISAATYQRSIFQTWRWENSQGLHYSTGICSKWEPCRSPRLCQSDSQGNSWWTSIETALSNHESWGNVLPHLFCWLVVLVKGPAWWLVSSMKLTKFGGSKWSWMCPSGVKYCTINLTFNCQQISEQLKMHWSWLKLVCSASCRMQKMITLWQWTWGVCTSFNWQWMWLTAPCLLTWRNSLTTLPTWMMRCCLLPASSYCSVQHWCDIQLCGSSSHGLEKSGK